MLRGIHLCVQCTDSKYRIKSSLNPLHYVFDIQNWINSGSKHHPIKNVLTGLPSFSISFHLLYFMLFNKQVELRNKTGEIK